MDALVLTVRILNNALSGGEKIARLGSVEGSPLLRKAELHVTDDLVRLLCKDDVGTVHELGKILRPDLKRIQVKKSVFTPGPQLLKPALSGFFIGAIVAGITWYRFGDRPGSAIHDSPIGAGILMALGVAVVFVLVNLGSIVWEDLAVVAFEATDGTHVDVAIQNNEADSLASIFAGKGASVE